MEDTNSEAIERARLVAERADRWPCRLVASDAIKCGTETRCIDLAGCHAPKLCAWRKFHQIPADKMRYCDVGLDD